MARPRQTGLNYFPFDVGFFGDKKIKRLKGRYGADGLTLYLYILCEIYKDTGYYVKFDDDFADMVSDDLNMSIEKIGQILNYLLSRSLFDNTLFQSVKVLTSHGIQARYQEAVKERAKKTPVEVNYQFWVLKENETQGFIKYTHFDSFSGKNGSNSRKNDSCSREEYHKVKESKEKESKGEESKEEEVAAPTFIPYGVLGNVLLTEDQRQQLKDRYNQSDKLIDKISAIIANRKDKSPIGNCFAYTLKIAEQDEWPKKQKTEYYQPRESNGGVPMPDELREKMKKMLTNVRDK